jgi:hypothetical protein
VRYEYLSGLPTRFLKRPDLMAGIGLLKNVSARGIGLLTEQPLTPRTALVLRLPGRSAGGGWTRVAGVVRVERATDGYWLAGCRLSVPLSREEVRGLKLTGLAPEG